MTDPVVLAIACNCPPGLHLDGCVLAQRLQIKAAIPYGAFCRDREWWERWIDQAIKKIQESNA